MLPPIRQELALHDGPPAADGSPTWMLHDPAANRFYALNWSAFEMLSRWPLRDAHALVAAVNRQTTLCVDVDDVRALVEFLTQHSLLEPTHATDSARLLAQASATRLSLMHWLLKNYLFVRVPLVRPARWLSTWAPRIAWVFLPQFWYAIGATAVVGLCLVSRQWDSFIGTFAQYKSFSGVLAIGAALALAKLLHELGHAFTAERYGCRVSTMGVAFLVMVPVLYTDTNEAWKLPDKRQRLRIAAAGVLAELGLAALATLLWCFLPDGAVRAGVFLLASTTWMLTLAINASPFMRFDGYFLLSDWLDMPNLHSRAFAQGRWWLREALFGWGEAPPEHFKPARQRFLIVFAFATWSYRLGVFLGIAYLVYDAVFKLLGVILLAIELGWFIAMPIGSELKVWWQRRAEFEWNAPTRRSAVLAVLLAIAFCVPLDSEVRAPAVLGAAQSQELYAVAAARVVRAPVAAGARVGAGQLLLQLESPDLEHQLGLAQSRAHSLREQLDRQNFDAKLLDEGAALKARWATALADVAGLQAQVAELSVRAPFAGRAVDVNEGLAPGSWVAAHEKLLHVIGAEGAKGEVLVSEQDLRRIARGAAWFVAERPEQPRVECRLGAIDRIALSALDTPYLASTYGGAVRVQAEPSALRLQADSAGALLPVDAVFRARLADCRGTAAPLQELRGTAHLGGDPHSIAGALLQHAIYVIQRELGR